MHRRHQSWRIGDAHRCMQDRGGGRANIALTQHGMPTQPRARLPQRSGSVSACSARVRARVLRRPRVSDDFQQCRIPSRDEHM